MTTMARLFIEIFDRRNRIERQLHRQSDSYAESLAFNVIADGDPPPPWLLDRAPGTAVLPDPGGLNKEQLISGIVFPVRMVNVSLVDPSTSFIMPEMADGNVCKPAKLFHEVPSFNEPTGVDLINKEDPKISKQNHNRAVEAKVIENFSEHDEMNMISNSRSIQRDSESNLSKKSKKIHLQGDDGVSNIKTGIKTRSRAASEKKLDCVNDSFVSNKCAGIRSGCRERVTRSRSRLLANEFNSSDKLAGVNNFYQVKDISNQSTECDRQIQQLQYAELTKMSSGSRDNDDIALNYAVGDASVSDEMEFLKSSTLPDTISLVEREKPNVIHDCEENGNTSVEFPYENQSHSRDNILSRPEAMQTESGKSTWRQSMVMHVSPNQQVQQRDMLRDAEDISIVEDDRSTGAMEEDKVAFLVVEDLKHSLHFSSSCEQPGLPFTSSPLSPTRSVTLNSFVGTLSKVAGTVISRESSSGNTLSHSREEQLCGELEAASEDDAALCQNQVKSMLGGTDLQFHELKESACRKKSAAGLNVLSSKCACSYIVSGNKDNFQSLGEESLCEAHASLLEIQPLEGDNLTTVASLSGNEAGSGPVNCQVEREVSEVADPSFNFNTTINNYKPSDGHVSSSSELDFESSKYDCSPQFTYCPVSSCLRWSGDHICKLNISGNSASKLSSKCPKKLKSLESFSEGEKDRYKHSTHAYQSRLAASFPLQNKVLRKFNSQNFTTEAARSVKSSAKALDPTRTNDASITEAARSVKSSAKALDPTRTNDASIPDEHSVGTVDDDATDSVEVDISILPLSKREDMSLSAQRTDSEISFLEVMDNIDSKTSTIADNDIFQGRYFLRTSSSSVGNNAIGRSNSPVLLKSDSIHLEDTKVAICPDTAEKSMIEKALVSEPHEKVSDCEHENSYPRRKKKYKYSNIIATSPRSRTRSFLAINQQNVCKYQTESVSDAVVLQSPPKSSIIQIPTVQPPATEQNNKLHVLKDDSDFRSRIHNLLITPNGVGKNKDLRVVEENLSVCSLHQVIPTNLMLSESEIQHTTRDAESLFSYVDAFENRASDSLGHHDECKEPYDAPQCLYISDITSISDTAGVNVNCDEIIPEFEKFNFELPYTLEDSIIYKDDDIPSIAKERAVALEKLRQSSIIPTPSSKPSLMNKINIISNGFHSLPLGMLEQKNLVFPFEPNNPDINNITASSSIKLMDLCCNMESHMDGPTLERSQSLCSSSTWFSSDLKNLSLTPPVRKFTHGRLSTKRRSAAASSIQELTCFRIDENSSTIEENGDFVQVEHSSSRNLEVSSNVKSLSDETGFYQNNTRSPSNSRKFMVRDSLESVNSDSTCSHGFEYVVRESKVKNKENPRNTNDIKKPQKATGRLSKMQSRLSSKSSESYGNYQNISKGRKPSNIVSSISSFVPHIQQKQQGASRLQGMKDIKVKALEAAETAKRLEDQKKLEREKKKAATKLEREKIRQENTKLLKLKQKQKEEEKRKKEECVAARKRQREEEEARKIKERKRRCVEETRTLQKECEEKMHYDKNEKDFQQKAMDEKQNKRKRTSKALRNLEKGGSTGSQLAAEVQQHTIQHASGTTNLCDDKSQALGVSDEHNLEMGFVCSNLAQEPNEETLSATQISPGLQSYDMSPYQNSDDEEREDSWHKKKYIPKWARRESLSEVILAIQHLDPKEIFSRKRSFIVSRVLPAHALPRRPLR